MILLNPGPVNVSDRRATGVASTGYLPSGIGVFGVTE